MKNITKKILIGTGIIVAIITVYLLMLSTTKGIFDRKLPIFDYVQDFHFTDQDGDLVSNNTFEDKVYVADYFYTTCTGICPKMNFNLSKVYKHFKDNPNFAVISHTTMPEVDSVPRLKAYQKRMLGDEIHNAAKWYFVTGPKDFLYKVARESYQIDNPDNHLQNVQDDFIHTQFIALVDQQKRVRGIYDGLKKDELAQLQKDITTLLEKKN